MLSIRKGLALTLAATMVIAAGCGTTKNDAGTGGGNQAAAAPVKIAFWHGMADDSAHGKVLTKMVADFNASQKAVVVEASYQGSYTDLDKKVVAALSAGNQPAVVQNTDSMLAGLVKGNSVQPLDALINKDDLKDYVPSLLKATTWNGKLMALPFNKSVIVLIYDKNKVKEAPKTWDEFKRTAAATTVKGKSFGTALDVDQYEFGTHYAQAGGTWVKDDKALFNDPAGVEALEFLTSMVKDGIAATTKSGDYKSDYFNDGRAAMVATTSASYAFIKPKDPSIQPAFAPLYAGPKSDAVPLSGANLSILNGISADQTKAAATFITWLTNKESTLQWGLGKTGYGPVRLSALQDTRWKDFAKANPEFGIVGDTLARGVVQANNPNWPAVQSEIKAAVQKTFLGQATAKEALDAAAKKGDELLGKK